MPKNDMGYPLPAGDAFTDELACLMVFYPDKPEYRQAFFGAYFYLSNWLAWERDPDKKGKDAASAWKLAIEETLGCIEMNTCETILQLLEDIKANTGVYCCDTGDITDGDQYTDAVEDGEGNVPQNIIDAGYATGTSDWAGFDDYKCMISHLMITNIEWQTRKYLEYTDEAGAVLGGAAALAAIAAVILATGGTALVLGIVLGVAAVAGLYTAISEMGEAALSNLATNIATNHDELACAIYNADGSAGAVDDLKDKIDELFNVAEAALLKNYNLPAQLKALYAGRYDQQDIADLMDTNGYETGDYTCDCEVDYGEWQSPLEDGDGGVLHFMNNNGWNFGSLHGNPTGNDGYGWRKPFNNLVGIAESTVVAVRGATGLPTGTGMDMTVNRIRWDQKRTTAGAAQLQLTVGPGTVTSYTPSVGSWETVEYVPATPIFCARPGWCIRFEIKAGGTSGYTHIDNVIIDFDGPT